MADVLKNVSDKIQEEPERGLEAWAVCPNMRFRITFRPVVLETLPNLLWRPLCSQGCADRFEHNMHQCEVGERIHG